MPAPNLLEVCNKKYAIDDASRLWIPSAPPWVFIPLQNTLNAKRTICKTTFTRRTWVFRFRTDRDCEMSPFFFFFFFYFIVFIVVDNAIYIIPYGDIISQLQLLLYISESLKEKEKFLHDVRRCTSWYCVASSKNRANCAKRDLESQNFPLVWGKLSQC